MPTGVCGKEVYSTRNVQHYTERAETGKRVTGFSHLHRPNSLWIRLFCQRLWKRFSKSTTYFGLSSRGVSNIYVDRDRDLKTWRWTVEVISCDGLRIISFFFLLIAGCFSLCHDFGGTWKIHIFMEKVAKHDEKMEFLPKMSKWTVGSRLTRRTCVNWPETVWLLLP